MPEQENSLEAGETSTTWDLAAPRDGILVECSPSGDFGKAQRLPRQHGFVDGRDLVTGAGRGMGLDFARAALAAGHAVVASGRDSDRVSKALGQSITWRRTSVRVRFRSRRAT